MAEYPLYPLTASLAAGGWKLEEALEFQASNGFEALDDEVAIEEAILLGWDGTKLDILLNSWIGKKWDVMNVICKHACLLHVNKNQALEILARLDNNGRPTAIELAATMKEMLFDDSIVPEIIQLEIRSKAEQIFNEIGAAEFPDLAACGAL